MSIIFDGTSYSGEAFAILVRFVNDSFVIQQQLIAIQLLSKSLTGEEIAHELVQVVSTDLPLWSSAAKKILAIQPFSAAAERVFSLLNSGFGDLQGNSLKDLIEASIMLRYNY